MRVLLSTYGSHESYGSRGDVEPMVGPAVRLRALGAAAEESDALVPAMLAGGWL
jgi:hypothetical protein